MRKNFLYNKVAIITGASGGLGFAISKLLIEKYNCKVIGIARNEQKLLKNMEDLGDKKTNFSYRIFDVSVKDNWITFFEELKQKSLDIDILINNAGFMLPFNKFENYSDKEITSIIETNLCANIYSIKTLLPLLKQSKSPSIINICSSAGLCAVVGQSMYSATKYAMRGLTEGLQQDYKKQIYIAGVYPGFIKTDIMKNFDLDKKSKKLVEKMMMPVNKASKKIVRAIARKKKRIVLGLDGRFMGLFSRIYPKLTPSIITKVLKTSKLKIFQNVFEYNKEQN